MTIIQVIEKSVAVFSQNYLPLCRVNIKLAVVLLVTDKAELLDITTESRRHISFPSLIVDLCEHILLKIGFRKRVWKVLPVKHRRILRRDRHSY